MSKRTNEYSDLSHMKCDLRKLDAEQAAKTFHQFLCDVADSIGYARPMIRPPGSREEAELGWWVAWEDCPWPEWGITGGARLSGPFQGYVSMRSGVHHTAEETDYGPFYTDAGETWYGQAYYGFDLIFVPHKPVQLDLPLGE